MSTQEVARIDSATSSAPLAQDRSLLDRIAEEQAQRQAEVASRYMPTLTPKQFTEREKLIKELREMLVDGVDYGVIPGTEKPTLLLPGAQKVCAYFGYVPKYTYDAVIEDWTGAQYGEPLFYYRLECTLQKNKADVGGGLGSCNTWESKYRYRIAKPKCPACGAAAIIAGKAEYGGGFVCFKKQGGCGSKFPDDDARITEQPKGRIANPDFADVVNTVLKMAKKRAYIDSTLSATGLSQYFTQDVEDMQPEPEAGTRQSAPPQPAPDTRPVPEELKLAFERLREPGTTATMFKYLQDEMLAAGGMDADKEYTRIGKAMKAQHGKNIPLEAIRTAALDMWDVLVKYRAAKESAQASGLDQIAGGDTL